MKRGDVWWVNFEPAVGGEVRKQRPAVIVSNDSANKHLNRLQVVPLTTTVDRLWAVEKSLKRSCFASLQFCYATPSGPFFGVFAGATKLEGRDIAVFFAVFNSPG